MGVLDMGNLAISGFWDDFGMREAEVIYERVQAAEMPDAVICEAGKHMIDPRVEQLWIMGNVASAICRAHELTTEAREAFGDLSLAAWWWADGFNRRTVEMAQEALSRANVGEAARAECERKLDWALFFLSNAEALAQEIVESL